MPLTLHSHSVQDTLALGQRLGSLAPPGLFITLEGPLGAGKTHLVRGIAAGAQVADPTLVSSPTYVLLNIYPGSPSGKTVFHLDAYRAAGEDDFDAVGLDDLLRDAETDYLVVMEWPSRVAGLLPPDRLHIRIDVLSETARLFAFHPTGPQAVAVTDALSR